MDIHCQSSLKFTAGVKKVKGLLIKKKWLDKILRGEKVWEIRGSGCSYSGEIALIESGSGKVRGLARVKGVIGPMTLSDLKRFTPRHQVDETTLTEWGGYKNNYCWALTDVRKLDAPVSYRHPQGAVIWVSSSNLPFKKIADAKKRIVKAKVTDME